MTTWNVTLLLTEKISHFLYYCIKSCTWQSIYFLHASLPCLHIIMNNGKKILFRYYRIIYIYIYIAMCDYTITMGDRA